MDDMSADILVTNLAIWAGGKLICKLNFANTY